MENTLYHHGILGQKWGVRRFQNPDGTWTEAGKKRYGLSDKQVRKVHKVFDESGAFDDVSNKVFNITKADKAALNEARRELEQNTAIQKEITKKEQEMFKDIEEGSKDQHYYEAVSEIASYCDIEDDINNLSLDDVAGAAFLGIFEDGQQSRVNAYSMYAYKNGLVDKADDLIRRSIDAQEKCREAAADAVQKALDQVGGQDLTAYTRNPDYKASKALVTRMIATDQLSDYENLGGHYQLNQATYAKGFTDKHKQAIKKAEGIASHLKNNRDKNTWYLLNEAIDNLNISSAKVGDLSQSDWDRINREIDRLRN